MRVAVELSLASVWESRGDITRCSLLVVPLPKPNVGSHPRGHKLQIFPFSLTLFDQGLAILLLHITQDAAGYLGHGNAEELRLPFQKAHVCSDNAKVIRCSFVSGG